MTRLVRFLRRRTRRDESGAALILAVGFMLFAGIIGAAMLPQIRSSAGDRVVLDQVRNRQYDADFGIEMSIARIRSVSPNPGSSTTECPTTGLVGDVWSGPNGFRVRVNCVNSPSVSAGPAGPVSQSNVSFTACLDKNLVCTPSTAIVTAQVNFQIVSGQVQTFVQSWSVNQ